jgi:hypothetical protein
MTQKPLVYTHNCVVISKNLPPKLIEQGFQNNVKYRVSLDWLSDTERSYFIAANHLNIRLQNLDGLLSGYAQFFDVVDKDDLKL